LKRDPKVLAAGSYDLAVIGGGIYGAAIAREAALAGLRVALVERHDFAAATSSNNHKVIHGGLRYLQHLDLPRVRESLRERCVLETIAPHLVHPLPVVVPTFGHGLRGKELLRIGVAMHRLFALATGDARAGTVEGLEPGPISRRRLLQLLPGLEASDATGGVLFYDSQVYSSERLVIAYLRAAAGAGARVVNYVEATGFVVEGGNVRGLTARDMLGGGAFEVRARAVVNAAGPWIPRVLASAGIGWREGSAARGLNVVTRQLFPAVAAGLYGRRPHEDPAALLRRGQRLYFLVPWRDRTIIGTAYSPFGADPSQLSVEPSDVEELLAEVNFAYPPARLTLDDVSLVYSGVLPSSGVLPGSGEVQVAKHYRIADHSGDGMAGLFSVEGVKYTTARDVAARFVERLFRSWSKRPPPSRSTELVLPGGSVGRFEDYLRDEIRRRSELPAAAVERLVRTYGSAYGDVLRYLDPDGGSDDAALLCAEARHAVREEMALTLGDVVFRRTEIGTAGHPGRAAIDTLAGALAAELDWSPQRVAREIAEVESRYGAAGTLSASWRTC